MCFYSFYSDYYCKMVTVMMNLIVCIIVSLSQDGDYQKEGACHLI